MDALVPAVLCGNSLAMQASVDRSMDKMCGYGYVSQYMDEKFRIHGRLLSNDVSCTCDVIGSSRDSVVEGGSSWLV